MSEFDESPIHSTDDLYFEAQSFAKGKYRLQLHKVKSDHFTEKVNNRHVVTNAQILNPVFGVPTEYL